VDEETFRKKPERTLALCGERDHVCWSVKRRRSASDEQLDPAAPGWNAISRKAPASAGHEIDCLGFRRDEIVRDEPKVPRRGHEQAAVSPDGDVDLIGGRVIGSVCFR